MSDKAIALGVILMLMTMLCGVSYYSGYQKGTTELKVLKDRLDIANNQAKEAQHGWELSTEELVKQHNRNDAALRERIKRLLHTKGSDSTTSISARASDERAKQCTIGEEAVDVEGCLVDTMLLMEFQQWVKDKNFPIQH